MSNALESLKGLRDVASLETSPQAELNTLRRRIGL